jgi:hypothetical protein
VTNHVTTECIGKDGNWLSRDSWVKMMTLFQRVYTMKRRGRFTSNAKCLVDMCHINTGARVQIIMTLSKKIMCSLRVLCMTVCA